jgi:hypothetical protein
MSFLRPYLRDLRFSAEAGLANEVPQELRLKSRLRFPLGLRRVSPSRALEWIEPHTDLS